MKYVSWFFGLVLLSACGESPSPKYVPTLPQGPSQAPVLIRFEEEVFAFDSSNVETAVENLAQKYPNFGKIYMKNILSDGRSNEAFANLDVLLHLPYAYELRDSIRRVFPQLTSLVQGCDLLNQHHAYYFSQSPRAIDTLYTFLSVYNHGVVLVPNGLGLGLDFFLGPAHPGYLSIEHLSHQYIRRQLTPDHILPRIAQVLCQDLLSQVPSINGNRFIDALLRQGKEFYLLDKLLPNVADSAKFGFTPYQLEYCEKGEKALYDYLVKDIGLFNEKMNDFRKYVEPGPFDPPLGRPGNSGSWLGMRMWQAYENDLRKRSTGKNAQEIDRKIMAAILAETDVQKVLKLYRPR